MEQFRGALQSAGADLGDVVSVRCYVQNVSHIPLHNKLYAEYFQQPYPTRATLVDCLPPGLLFEIECVAYKPEGGA